MLAPIALLLAGAAAAPAPKHSEETKKLAPESQTGRLELVDPKDYSAGCYAAWEVFDADKCWCHTGCALDCTNGGTPGKKGSEIHPEWCEEPASLDGCEGPTLSLIEACSSETGPTPGLADLVATAPYVRPPPGGGPIGLCPTDKFTSKSTGISCVDGLLAAKGGDTSMRWKETASFAGAKLVGHIKKTHMCSDHFIALTSNPDFHWSWGSSDDAIKFVWNCNSKMIYYPKRYSSTRCMDNKDYVITTTIAANGTVTFADDGGCKELTATLTPAMLKDFKYLYIGADDDTGTAIWYGLEIFLKK